MDVLLSWSEVRAAAYAGIDRKVRVLAANRRSPASYGPEPNIWESHVIGAIGECVIAKAAGMYWSGDLERPDGGAGDVGSFHVRTTTRVTGSLLLHNEDTDSEPFVLVVITRLPAFRIAGWVMGRDGKQAEYWKEFTGRPAFFVPQSALHPWATLGSATQ